jgi:hypothetical protein
MMCGGKRPAWMMNAFVVVSITCFFWPMLTREPLKILRPGGLPVTVEHGPEIANMHLVGYNRSEIGEKYGQPARTGFGQHHPKHWRWFRKYPD